MADIQTKQEIDLNWKRIQHKVGRATIDDEVAGQPNYLVASPDFTPLGSEQGGVLGNTSASAINAALDSISSDKLERINRYQRMSSAQEHPEVEGILNIYADEITSEDNDGNIFIVRHPNQDVEMIINNMIERLGLYDKVWEIAWNMCGYGDDFWEVIPSQSMNRILKINWIPRDQVERVEENGMLKGFRALDPKEETDVNANTTYLYHVAKETQKEKDQNMIYPFRILHFKIPSKKYGIYGKSIIDTIIQPIEQLKLMERAMTIARVVRSPERRVYTVDVGNLTGEKAIKYAYDAVNYGKKKRSLDNFTNGLLGGASGASKRPDLLNDVFGSTEDIILPKRQGTDGNSITTLDPQTGAGDVADLEFMRDKIFPPVGIPRQYLFDDTFANANVNLSSKSVPFARRIRRGQRFILRQIYKLAIIELKLQGYANAVADDLLIMMNNPSTLYEEKRIEIDTAKWGLISAIRQNNADGKIFFPDMLIYKDVLKLNDEQIVELLKLGQLQSAGENPFNIMPIEDRPEGAEDLGTNMNPQQQPNAASGAGAIGGGAVPPPPASGGDTAIPSEVTSALGNPPPQEEGGEAKASENTESNETPAPAPADAGKGNEEFFAQNVGNPILEAKAKKNKFLQALSTQKQSELLIVEDGSGAHVEQTIYAVDTTKINTKDSDTDKTKPTGISISFEEIDIDGELAGIDKVWKRKKQPLYD